MTDPTPQPQPEDPIVARVREVQRKQRERDMPEEPQEGDGE